MFCLIEYHAFASVHVFTCFYLELLQELFGTCSRTRINRQLHFAYLFVDVLHELDYEVDELLTIHLLRVRIRY